MPEPAVSAVGGGARMDHGWARSVRAWVAVVVGAALAVSVITPAGASDGDGAFVATDDAGAPLGPVAVPAVDLEDPIPVEDQAVGGQVTTMGVAGFAAAAVGDSQPLIAQDTNWAATPLGPSTGWQVSAQTGTFSWSYPFTVPPSPAGPAPDLALTYSSGAVDGIVASTNNQTSWIGEGWDLSAGFIERSYLPCAKDGHPENPGLCWSTDNATVVFAGSGGPLVKDAATGAWHLRDDDGTRVEHITAGDYWRLTTTEGVQYYFGRGHRPADTVDLGSRWQVPVFGDDAGEPCHAETGSWCQMVWRWNLEYVVDTSGNTMTYFYAPEANRYRLDEANLSVSYTAGGHLARVEYGQVAGAETNAPAPVRVVFAVGDRCLDGSCTDLGAEHWPDVPEELTCTSVSSCPVGSYPAFFTRKRLVDVTSQVFAAGGSYSPTGYSTVDSWHLDHAFVDPGDNSTMRPNILWLDSVTHTGAGGDRADVPVDPVTFAGTALPNRVDAPNVGDGHSPMNRFRLTSITNESGGVTTVTYATSQAENPGYCSPARTPAAEEGNPLTCFKVKWTDEGGNPVENDFFHKYLVAEVSTSGEAGSPGVTTTYTYSGDAAWQRDTTSLLPVAERMWNDFRGFAEVAETTGSGDDALRTAYEFYRGVGTDGEGVDRRLNGFTRRTTVYDGADKVSEVINTPWLQETATAADGTQAKLLGVAGSRTETFGPSGSRTTGVETLFGPYGRPWRVSDSGDVDDASDDRCTVIEYQDNVAAHIVAAPKLSTTYSGACADTAPPPADVIAGTRFYYDGLIFGAVPTKGLVTGTGQLDGYSGTTPTWAPMVEVGYDDRGRVISQADQLGRTTTTAYTETASGLVVGASTTAPDPDGPGPVQVTSTMDVDPGWGTPVRSTDPNGKVSVATLDGLGRVAKVWGTDRDPEAESPTATYDYSQDLTTVTSRTLTADGGYTTSVAISDRLGRARQTQTDSANAETGGRVITDTIYDDRGLVALTQDGWYTDGEPSGTIAVPLADVPVKTSYTYDGAGRVTHTTVTTGAETTATGGPVRTTVTSYDVDRVTVTPPAGGTPTTTITDARGQTIELRRYTTATPTGDYQAVTYAYDHAGRLTGVADAAGNTWAYTFDLLGRQISADDPDKGQTTTRYDDAGQVVATTDANDNVLGFTYDALGRKTGRYELTSPAQAPATGTPLATWEYDTLAVGQRTSSTRHDPSGEYTVAVTGYDEAYRPTGQTVTLPPAVTGTGLAGSYTTGYTYTQAGQPQTITLPAVTGPDGTVLDAETVTYHYDTANQPEWVGSGRGWGTYVSDSTWSPYGQLLQTRLGTTWAYFVTHTYAAGSRRLAGTTVHRQTTTGLSVDLNVGYSYDPAGNPTQLVDTAGGTTDRQCYTYDGLGHLTTAWTASADCQAAPGSWSDLGGPAPYWQEYTYTPTGDRSTLVAHTAAGATTSTYTYQDTAGDPVHGVTAVTSTGAAPGTAAFAYDATGNTTHRTVDGHTQTLGWDAEGHLATVDDDTAIGAEGRYVYTADGDRLVRTQNGATTVYLPGGQEITATGGQLSVQRSYAFAGQVVAVRTGPGNDQVWSMVSDPHHSATVAINNAATPGDPTGVVKRRMDPFGNPRGTTTTWPTDKGLMNKPVDASGLTQVGARYYDPVFGRFITVDPIMNLADPNQWAAYAYANNNPVTNWDPDGLLVAGDFETLGQAQKRQQQATKISTRSSRAGGGTSGQPSRSSGSPEIEFNPNADIERQIAMGTLYQEGLASELETRREQTCQDRISAGLAPCGTPEAREEGAWMLAGAAGGIAGELVIGGLVARIALVRGSAVASAANTGTARFVVNSAGDVLDTTRVSIPAGKFDYLLKNPSKSGVFSDSMGFDQAGLDSALRSHLTGNFGSASPSVPMVGGGTKFTVRGPMTGPSGQTWDITTAWGVDPNGTIRLITATP